MSIDILNTIAWRDFILWAWNEPQLCAQFTAETGLQIRTATTPIDIAIDAAAGAGEGLVARFVEWVTRNHWGLEYAPEAYQKAVNGKLDRGLPRR